jgi:hypothetical protein
MSTRTTIERILRDADDASGQTCRGWTIEVSDGVIVMRDFNALPFITFGVADVSALFGDLRLAMRAAFEQSQAASPEAMKQDQKREEQAA